MATWQDILGGLGQAVGVGGDAYLLFRQRSAEEKVAKERASAERAKAEADLISARANSDTIANFGKWAMVAAGAMLAITLLSQVRRMWRTR